MSEPAARAQRLPAFVNPRAGTAADARAALDAELFDVREVDPRELGNAIEREIGRGARRIVVAGGDGTIAAAADAVAGTGTELAILPGGTLNHFARSLDLPLDLVEAARCARGEVVAHADVGRVNGRIFLNTSSVGAYTKFVKLRDRLERWLGYRLASLIAAARVLFGLPHFDVELDLDGERKVYRTSLIFIGVGERELKAPTLGARVPGGQRGLHVMVVHGRTATSILALTLSAVSRGLKVAERKPTLDAFLVDRCTVRLKRRGPVAVDGEVVTLDTPLEYELARDAVAVVVEGERRG